MLSVNNIPARSLQKSYKAIIDGVKIKKQAIILTRNNQPQAALVSLEDLEKLEQAKATLGSMKMLKFALENREELRGLPADLRERADEILYSK